MITNITYKVFAEQVQRRLQNGWPNNSFSVTSNEIFLHLYECIAAAITKASADKYALEGIEAVPEGFITTFKFSGANITENPDTGDFEITLPQVPINISSGVGAPYFTGAASKSYPLMKLDTYNRSYALKMPTPNYGGYWWLEGNKLFLSVTGIDLINNGWKIYVPMVSTRAVNGLDSDVINVPEDILGSVYDMVIARLTQRVQTPKDNSNDGVDKKTDP